MTMNTYDEWFRFIVEAGWVCGLTHPIEILANYLHSAMCLFPENVGEEIKPFIRRYMIDITTQESIKMENVSIEEAVIFFNAFYKDSRFDFGAYT